MSRTIDTVTVSAVEDRRLVLGGAQAARQLSFGSTWNHLRVGIRCSMDGATNIVGTPKFYLGVMSTPTADCANGPTGFTGHFVGVVSNLATWTYTTGAGPNHYAISAGGIYAGKKIGFTHTTTSITGGTHIPTTASTGNFRLFVVDIVKGSPNFTIYFLRPTTTCSAVECSQDIMIRCMNRELGSAARTTYMNSATGQTYSESAGNTVAVDEGTNGSLTSAVVSWERSAPLLYISDFMVCKLS